jgi:hypothetical protein
MTVDYKIDSALEIRKYLWDQFLTIGIFDEEEYYSDTIFSTIIPIIPVQQSPEMNQFFSGKKHIIYDKISMSYDTLWMICTEQILLTLYATDVSELNEMRNFIVDLFRRMDDSATDINRWENLSDKIKFHTIYISDISPMSPSEELQGFYAADVVLEVKSSRVIDQNGRYL